MAKFTRTHHRAVADLFWIRRQELDSVLEPATPHLARMREWAILQGRFRNMFASDNANFKPTLFDEACGLKG